MLTFFAAYQALYENYFDGPTKLFSVSKFLSFSKTVLLYVYTVYTQYIQYSITHTHAHISALSKGTRSFAIPLRDAVFAVKSRIVSVTDHLGLALLVRTSSKAISKLHSGDILPYGAAMVGSASGIVIGVARILELPDRFYEEKERGEENKCRRWATK